ncbi:2353_t:CDS:2, partial [Funneliformis geosporum]
MTKFIHEPRELINKYRFTEHSPLVILRGLSLTILLAILFLYGIILFFFATNDVFLMKSLISTPYVPVPVVKISSKYEFSMSCEINYLDLRAPTEEDIANCNKYIVPTECKELDPNNTFNGRCTGLFYPPIQDRFNYSLPDKRYGVSFLITITDEAYNAADDNGMQLRAYDQLFVPTQLPDSVRKTISSLNPHFMENLEEKNFHVIGYQQIPTFFTVLGVPPAYFPQPFIESRYESVQVPGVVSGFTPNTYGSLFVGTVDWTEEIQSEVRNSNVSNSIALLAAFYGLLVKIYVCLFGRSVIAPWGICQMTCCRRKTKNNLREKFPNVIPLVSRSKSNRKPKLYQKRLDAIEKFAKLYLVNIADQAGPKLRPLDIEDGDPNKKPPHKNRPFSPLSILNSAPMSRPISKVSKNNQENDVTSDMPSVAETNDPAITDNILSIKANPSKRPSSKRWSTLLPKSPNSQNGKSKSLPISHFNETGALSRDALDNAPNATSKLPTDLQAGFPSNGASNNTPNITNNLPIGSRTGGAPDRTPNTKSQAGTLSAGASEKDVPNSTPNTSNNLSLDTNISLSPNNLPKARTPASSNSQKPGESKPTFILSPIDINEDDANKGRRSSNVNSNSRKSVVSVDEEGNALSPEEAVNVRHSVVSVDEEVNALSPEEAVN